MLIKKLLVLFENKNSAVVASRTINFPDHEKYHEYVRLHINEMRRARICIDESTKVLLQEHITMVTCAQVGAFVSRVNVGVKFTHTKFDLAYIQTRLLIPT